jgi:hypothetical protein
VISTMYFISGWSLCGLLMWPFDNHGADHFEDAECISRAECTRFAFVPTANGPRVASGMVFYPAIRVERTQDQSIATSDGAQHTWWNGRFQGSCLRIDQWLIIYFSFFGFEPEVQVDPYLAEPAA